jgi:arylsulfatase A-like enzyme
MKTLLYTIGQALMLSVVAIACKVPSSNEEDVSDVYHGKIGKTQATSEEWWPEKKKAPAGAPNVIYFLIDDAGYGTASAFGGLMHTPTLDSLANNGLRFTNFHTTAICSPTRAALLHGRNSHSVHMGLFPVTATGFPGYDGFLPADKGSIAAALRANEYNTYAVGKYHLAPIHEITPVGPFDRWPTGIGFDHFYGWQLGHTDQYHPNLYEDNNVIDIEPNNTHVTTLLADKAIKYIANQRSYAPHKPFFLYFATGALHYPHQVDQKWIDLYKGKFDNGWDWYREETLKNQKRLGVVPEDAVLPDRDPKVPAWDSLTPAQQKLYARYMEVYAAFMTHTDYEFGRVVNYLKEIDQLENTIIVAIIGDNGSSPSSQHGYINSYISDLPDEEQVAVALKNIDAIGTEKSFPDAPWGWTQATNTPFRLWKSDAQAEGGTHNPLIIFYPKGIKEKGGIRNQYSHVIDIAPTTLELINGAAPDYINGVKQKPYEGTSLVYAIHDAQAKDRHTTQYYEIRGKRAIYKEGWKAAVVHQTGKDFDDDVWELYHIEKDFNERQNVATEYPEKLKELQAAFDEEARKYNVYPIHEEWDMAKRKISAFGLQDTIVLYQGADQILNFAGPQFHEQSFSISADVVLTGKEEGVLFSTGGAFDGLSLYILNGKFEVAHNTGSKVQYLTSSKALPKGKTSLRFELAYEQPSEKSSKAYAGKTSIWINDEKVGERDITFKEAKYIAYYKDGVDVGADLNSPVSDKYRVPFKFTGKLNTVTIIYK